MSHHNHGGSYIIEKEGQKPRLVHRTKSAEQHAQEQAAKAAEAEQSKQKPAAKPAADNTGKGE